MNVSTKKPHTTKISALFWPQMLNGLSHKLSHHLRATKRVILPFQFDTNNKFRSTMVARKLPLLLFLPFGVGGTLLPPGFFLIIIIVISVVINLIIIIVIVTKKQIRAMFLLMLSMSPWLGILCQHVPCPLTLNTRPCHHHRCHRHCHFFYNLLYIGVLLLHIWRCQNAHSR